MPPDSGLAIRVATLYAATFAWVGVFQPFFPIWLAKRGFTPEEMGLILGLPIFVRAVWSPLVTSLADGRLGVKWLLIGCGGAVAVGFAILPAAQGFWPVLLISCFVIATQGPAVPLTDVLAIEVLRIRPHLHYGRIRMWGSLSFLAANVGGGALLAVLEPSAIPVILSLSGGLIAMAALGTPAFDQRVRPRGSTGGEEPSAGNTRLYLVLVITAVAFSNASHAMLSAFGSLTFEQAGYSTTAIGALWGAGVVVEIIVFFLFGSAAGPAFPAFAFMAVGTAVGLLRWIGFASSPSPVLLFVLMAAHGISFGATLLATIGAFARLPSNGRRARQQGLLVAASAFLTGVATAASGPIFERWGDQGFLAMAPLSVVAIAATILAARVKLYPQNPVYPQSAGRGG